MQTIVMLLEESNGRGAVSHQDLEEVLTQDSLLSFASDWLVSRDVAAQHLTALGLASKLEYAQWVDLAPEGTRDAYYPARWTRASRKP